MNILAEDNFLIFKIRVIFKRVKTSLNSRWKQGSKVVIGVIIGWLQESLSCFLSPEELRTQFHTMNNPSGQAAGPLGSRFNPPALNSRNFAPSEPIFKISTVLKNSSITKLFIFYGTRTYDADFMLKNAIKKTCHPVTDPVASGQTGSRKTPL